MATIGVLDSGLGGMVMLEALQQRYPNQNFLFLADQKHSPYGLKTQEELIEIVNRNIAWLKQQGADSILMACNTISCLDASKICTSLPVQRVVEPTCRQLSNLNVHCVVVCATPFTCQSGSYEMTLKQLYPDLNVHTVPLPYLCRDIEEMTDVDSILCKLKKDLQMYRGKCDAVILGCTHYPLVKSLFEQVLQCTVVDSNGIELLNHTSGKGTVQYYTTDDPAYFDLQCRQLFHHEIHSNKAEF